MSHSLELCSHTEMLVPFSYSSSVWLYLPVISCALLTNLCLLRTYLCVLDKIANLYLSACQPYLHLLTWISNAPLRALDLLQTLKEVIILTSSKFMIHFCTTGWVIAIVFLHRSIMDYRCHVQSPQCLLVTLWASRRTFPFIFASVFCSHVNFVLLKIKLELLLYASNDKSVFLGPNTPPIIPATYIRC